MTSLLARIGKFLSTLLFLVVLTEAYDCRGTSRPSLRLYAGYSSRGKGHLRHDVRVLQRALNSEGGYSLKVDGYFGTNTDLKVRDWQFDNGLDVDGIVGVKTWTSLCDSSVQGGLITYDLVKNAVQRMGYTFFTGKYNINLVGIRGPNRNAGSWDDIFCVLYQDDEGTNRIKVFEEFTTDPGVFFLQHPMKENGCAIVAPGQYRGVWTIGRHRNRYEALVQTGAISVYRDNNKDAYLDMKTESIERGWYGINLHHGYNSNTVGKNSAGCQVFKSPSDLTTVLDICRKQQPNGYGSSFTYTVIDESDL